MNTGHLTELLPSEAATLAAAARILAERCVGPIAAVSLRASPGVCRLVVHLQSAASVHLEDAEQSADDIAATVKIHNAERSRR